MPLLRIDNLSTCFKTKSGDFYALDGLNLSIGYGETLGVVGESGCGKSMMAKSILRVLPKGICSIKEGSIFWKDIRLNDLTEKEMQKIRGKDISMIFQEPMTSLNPIFTVGDQIIESIMIHERNVSKAEAWGRAKELLNLVKIPSVNQRIKDYPHQMSGGMRQRVMIAMALACNPQLLIADEPTTALDVTIQAQILELLEKLQDKIGMSMILITHDLGVASETVKNIAVMYCGQIIEYAASAELFARPLHPYTQGLINSIPQLKDNPQRLNTIHGTLPAVIGPATSCRFATRCPHATKRCLSEVPSLADVGEDHMVRCFLMEGKDCGGCHE
jgi:oligopeptide/dipeptide ABC transporter ATP-binding protein